MLTLQNTPNFRDLGGLGDAAGRTVRAGRVYRSELMASVSAQDVDALTSLKIASVFDLRNLPERIAAPSAWPPASDLVRLHVQPHDHQVAGADLQQLLARLSNGTLEASHTAEIMRDTYRAMPSLFADVLGVLFHTLAEPDAGATLIHCTAGKDRTGFVCAMLLFALDVPFEQIMHDYLASASHYPLARLVAHMEKLAGQALDERTCVALAEMAQVKASYLELAVDEIVNAWGSVSGYLERRAGLDRGMRARMQMHLLV